MKKTEKAAEIVKKADLTGSTTIQAGSFLQTSASMIAEQKGWEDEDPCKAQDYTTAPYWLTTDDGVMPAAITGADDSDLLDMLEDDSDE